MNGVEGGTQTPLFLIAAPEGVTEIVGAPVVPIVPQRHHTVEAMAMGVVAHLRSIRPRGPFRLAGAGDEGLIAYEAANQLIGQDACVEFVGMIDTMASPRRGTWGSQARPAAYVLERIEGCTPARDALADEDEDGRSSFSQLIDRYKSLPLIRDRLELHSPDELYELYARLSLRCAAADDYVIAAIPTTVYLFVTTDHDLGWNTTVMRDRLEIVPVAETLAKSVSKVLAGLQSETRVERNSMNAHKQRWIAIAGSSSRQSVFCIPGAGGNATAFASFADAISSAGVVLASQPRGLDLTETPHTSVQAAAAELVQEMLHEQRIDAFHLVGHSFGGWIALEAARQLVEAGRQPKSLTLIDVHAPGAPPKEFAHLEILMAWIKIVELASGKPLGIGIREMDLLDPSTQMDVLHSRMVEAGLLPRRSRADVLIGPVRTFGSAVRCGYTPAGVYPFPTRLVLAEESYAKNGLPSREQITSEWLFWAPNLEVWECPGNHMTLLNEPNVRVLADWWFNSSR